MIAHIKGTARARSLAFFIPRANEDFGIFCIITLPINVTTHERRLLQYYIYCFLTITHCGFKSLKYFSMCWTIYSNTCSIRAAGSCYISIKPAGPVTRIALLSYCITYNVLIVPFFKCNLRSNVAKQFT